MKHPNHFGRWLACVLLCLLLAGCSMPGEQVQVEELLRAPKLSGDYGDVQTALNDWLGESAQLKYPMQGDLLSPFLLQDLDGAGRMPPCFKPPPKAPTCALPSCRRMMPTSGMCART